MADGNRRSSLVSRTGTPRRHTTLLILLTVAMSGGLQGCVVIGGSSRGGFFVWPGGLGLLLMIALFVLLSRRR